MKIFSETFIRILAILSSLAVFIVLIATLVNFTRNQEISNFSFLKGNKDSAQIIAILRISGPIISDPSRISSYDVFNSLESIYPSLIEDYLNELKTKNITGLIVSINSPGGSVSATKTIYDKFIKFKEKKNIPIYFHSSDILASGGYWISLAGDKIFTNYGAIIGSIGVKGPDWIYFNNPTSLSNGIFGNYVESKNGIKLFSNSAGFSKDIYNPFRKPSESEIILLNEMVTDIYETFVTLASSSRKIEKNIIKNQIGAMIYNTNQAKKKYLIDGVKTLDEVINLLKKNNKLEQVKIIINKKTDNYNFFNLSYNNLIDKNSIDNYKNIIKSKFCNNYLNELSTVIPHSYIAKCQ
jgi:protease-4